MISKKLKNEQKLVIFGSTTYIIYEFCVIATQEDSTKKNC